MTTAPIDSATSETADAVGIRSSALFGLRPYYKDSHITLYHGDCVEIMRAMDGVSVDAVITDPPYCSGGALEAQKNSGGQGHRSERLASGEVEWFAADNMTTGGLVWLVRAVLVESRRVMKANRSAFVFTDWRMAPHLAPALESSGLRYRNMIVWDKMNAGLGMGFKPAHEIILEYTNGVTEYATKDGQNVIRSRRVSSGTRDHACQKPLEVLAKLIDVAVPPGGTVLDPFSGSGSTLVAAKQRGRKAIGIELAESHCETIARRCAQEMALFMDCPNDLKLRDRGARRGSCAVGLRGAATVTCGAVLCSAWLDPWPLSERLLANWAFLADVAPDEAVNPLAATANEVALLAGFSVFDFSFFAARIAGSFHIWWLVVVWILGGG